MSNSESGNTSHSPRKRRWRFVLNNPSELEEDQLHSWLSQKSNCFVYQLEEGKLKTPHLQGYVEFPNQMRFDTFKNVNNRLNLMIADRSKASNVSYCTKLEGRLKEPRFKNIVIPKKIKIIEELFEWQKNIIDLIETEPDDRTINWFWDEPGLKGKSALAKYICYKYQTAILLTGRCADCKYAITKFIDDNHFPPEIIIFDFSRSQETFVSYQAIEEVKNGIFFNTKYESKMVLFNSPHVLIFSNFPPNKEMLSADRWNITALD